MGESALALKSGKFILENLKDFLLKNNFLFFDKLKNDDFKLIYLLGADEITFDKKDKFVIYQGSHGDKMAQMADIVLPSPAYTEQDGLFINLEGRLQKCLKASYPPGSSKEDWKIFNLVNKRLKNDFIFKNFRELRVDTLKKIKNHSDYDLLPKTNPKLIRIEDSEFFSENLEIDQFDYYFSNAIARSSKTMSDCKIARSNNSKK